MFEALTREATSRELAALVSANHAELVERETRVLQLTAAWADVPDLDPAGVEYRPLIERACAWGGPGTPAVSEYCAVELGALQGTGEIAARMLTADALDLRHLLPRLWKQVQAGEVRAWQARRVAEATPPCPGRRRRRSTTRSVATCASCPGPASSACCRPRPDGFRARHLGRGRAARPARSRGGRREGSLSRAVQGHGRGPGRCNRSGAGR